MHDAGRFSGSRIVLLAAPSPRGLREWHLAAFVPEHSGGTAVDSHHLPFRSSPYAGDRRREIFSCQCCRRSDSRRRRRDTTLFGGRLSTRIGPTGKNEQRAAPSPRGATRYRGQQRDVPKTAAAALPINCGACVTVRRCRRRTWERKRHPTSGDRESSHLPCQRLRRRAVRLPRPHNMLSGSDLELSRRRRCPEARIEHIREWAMSPIISHLDLGQPRSAANRQYGIQPNAGDGGCRPSASIVIPSAAPCVFGAAPLVPRLAHAMIGLWEPRTDRWATRSHPVYLSNFFFSSAARAWVMGFRTMAGAPMPCSITFPALSRRKYWVSSGVPRLLTDTRR